MTYISLIQPIYDYNSTSKWLVSAVSDTKEKYIDLKKKIISWVWLLTTELLLSF